MWSIAGIVVFSIVIAWIEVPVLRKRKWKKERWFFWFFLFLALVLCVLQVLDIDIPNPLDGIAFVFKPFSDALLKLLK